METNAFRQYVYQDHARRRRDDRLSMAIAMFAGVLALLLGYSEEVASIAAIVVLAVSMTWLTVYYIRNSARLRAESQTGQIAKLKSRR